MAVHQLGGHEVIRGPAPQSLITHVKVWDKAKGRTVDLPVEAWLQKWTKDRERELRSDGTIDSELAFECIAGGIDLRTGKVYDGLNGSPGNTIPSGEVHPFIKHRMDELHNIRHSHPRNDHAVVTRRPHGDHPLRHAEVKVVNEILHDRDRHSHPFPVDHERMMKEIVVDVRFPNQGRIPDEGIPAPLCANCNHLLHGVSAIPGRFAGNPPLDGVMESPGRVPKPSTRQFPGERNWGNWTP